MNVPPSSLEDRLLERLIAVREHEDPAARAQLNDLLRSDPAARAAMARLLVDEQALINRLRQDGIVAMLQPKARPPVPRRAEPSVRQGLRRVSKSRGAWTSLAAAAVLVLAGFLGWRVLRPSSGKIASSVIQPVAVLKESADAVWKEASPAPGASLVPGGLKLESGMAAIEFTSGARVLLEGPAELDLVSGMEVFCRSGKLRANVPPPAQGFTIVTPSSRVVDLGTTFGLSVRGDGGALVKVMQGKVELRRGDAVFPLKENAAASIDPAGQPSPADSPDEAFPSEENFKERIAAGERQTAARWQAASSHLANDPAALLSFTFQESTHSSRSARNHAAGAPVESHGSLVGAGWAEGRWPGKRALEFKGQSDSMPFILKQTAPAATLLAWVRVDSLPNSYHILLMPDYRQASALQWMIVRNGELRLALKNGVEDPGTLAGWDGPVKAPAISTLDFGRWVFLASTYDSKTGKVVHYRDGRQIGTGYFEHKLPVEFGLFSFGNWPESSRGILSEDDDTEGEGCRNFIGCLDELTILSRALSPWEIEYLHDQGKP
jgi:hypothetical protein